MKKQPLIILTVFMLLCNSLYGQSGLDDFMRSTGKIYVVVGVILAMFIGIVIYLYRMDKKLTNLENQILTNGKKTTSSR